MTSQLRGIITPTTTPFTVEGDIDFDAVTTQVNWCIEAGVHGLAAGGSTGEGHTLDIDEYRALMEATVEAVDGRVPVVAGIIVDSTPRRHPTGKGGPRSRRGGPCR